MERKPGQNGRFSCSFSFLGRSVQADALIIMVLIRRTDPVTLVMAHTDPVTRVMVHTDPVMPVPLAIPTQAPSRSRLAIGRITLAALVITWAAPITSGGRDIGQGATVKESGFMATMC
jgi:hypothetical protein